MFCFCLNRRVLIYCGLIDRSVNTKRLFNTGGCVNSQSPGIMAQPVKKNAEGKPNNFTSFWNKSTPVYLGRAGVY